MKKIFTLTMIDLYSMFIGSSWKRIRAKPTKQFILLVLRFIPAMIYSVLYLFAILPLNIFTLYKTGYACPIIVKEKHKEKYCEKYCEKECTL
jgi:hypothetical protein